MIYVEHREKKMRLPSNPIGQTSLHSMISESWYNGTNWKNNAHGIVELIATIQIQPIMMRARFLDNCIFKGHQIARNLEKQEKKKIHHEKGKKSVLMFIIVIIIMYLLTKTCFLSIVNQYFVLFQLMNKMCELNKSTISKIHFDDEKKNEFIFFIWPEAIS